MIQIGSKFYYPKAQSWNDLDHKGLYMIYHYLYGQMPKNLEESEEIMLRRMQIACYLLDISDIDIKVAESEFMRQHGKKEGVVFFGEFLMKLQSYADAFFDIEINEDNERRFSPKLGLTKCPYPFIYYDYSPGKKRKMYAAADEFLNMTIYEMGTVFTLFEQYIATNSLDIVHKLLAIIYRYPKDATAENKKTGYNGDIRMPLRGAESMINRRAEHLSKTPDEFKQLIVFWIASCRNSIIKDYPNVFKKSVNTQENEKDYGWGGVLLALADGLQNLNEISDQNIHNVLLFLSMKEDERQSLEFKKTLAQQ